MAAKSYKIAVGPFSFLSFSLTSQRHLSSLRHPSLSPTHTAMSKILEQRQAIETARDFLLLSMIDNDSRGKESEEGKDSGTEEQEEFALLNYICYTKSLYRQAVGAQQGTQRSLLYNTIRLLQRRQVPS